jgi:DNA recombination protein RmuC
MEIAVGIIATLAGAAVGFLGAQLLAARRMSALRAEAAAGTARAAQLTETLTKQEADLSGERRRNDELTARAASAETACANLESRLAEEAARLSEVQAQFRAEFENLANRILEEKSAKFLSQNQEHISVLLDPLRQRLGEFRERIETIHNEDVQSTAALREQLLQLRELNRQMTDEAAALTRALKGESKTQGSWGELILERILEKSGLQKGLEYDTQASFRSEDGARFQPDVVIRLPENRHLIVDAKVSLTAYERFVNAGSDAERQSALREHALSVRRHVEELSRKDYPSLPELQSPDFVLMFIPVEPALHMALQQDGTLFGDAFERNVVLVSSSTLLITLRAIESVWRRQKQTLNALEIARQAGNLHDQFVLFVESLQEIGQRIEQARVSYEQALGRLSTGRGNLVKRTMELQKLGARAERQLPPGVVQGATEGDE